MEATGKKNKWEQEAHKVREALLYLPCVSLLLLHSLQVFTSSAFKEQDDQVPTTLSPKWDYSLLIPNYK